MSDRDWVTVDGVRYEPRDKVIEECAKAADDVPRDEIHNDYADIIIAAIRALRDK